MAEIAAQEKKQYHVLVTGLSGTGKTTLHRLFKDKGIPSIDADESVLRWGKSGASLKRGESFRWLLRNRPKWDVSELKRLMRDNDELYVFGIAPNMPRTTLRNFDQIIYLKADRKLLKERLQTERDNPYGTTRMQRKFVMIVKPMLDFAADAASRVSKRFRNVDASKGLEDIFSDIIGNK